MLGCAEEQLNEDTLLDAVVRIQNARKSHDKQAEEEALQTILTSSWYKAKVTHWLSNVEGDAAKAEAKYSLPGYVYERIIKMDLSKADNPSMMVKGSLRKAWVDYCDATNGRNRHKEGSDDPTDVYQRKDLLTNVARQGSTISLNDCYETEDGEKESVSDYVGTYDANQYQFLFKDWLKKLTILEQQVLIMTVYAGYTQSEIADRLHKSKRDISKALKSIRNQRPEMLDHIVDVDTRIISRRAYPCNRSNDDKWLSDLQAWQSYLANNTDKLTIEEKQKRLDRFNKWYEETTGISSKIEGSSQTRILVVRITDSDSSDPVVVYERDKVLPSDGRYSIEMPSESGTKNDTPASLIHCRGMERNPAPSPSLQTAA